MTARMTAAKFGAAYQSDRLAKKRKRGECLACKAKALKGYSLCEKHRKENTDRVNARNAARRLAGVCLNCTAPICAQSPSYCEKHYAKTQDNNAKATDIAAAKRKAARK